MAFSGGGPYASMRVRSPAAHAEEDEARPRAAALSKDTAGARRGDERECDCAGQKLPASAGRDRGAPPAHDAAHVAIATASISTRASRMRRAHSKVVRAGGSTG